jgi:hypothetical protein
MPDRDEQSNAVERTVALIESVLRRMRVTER